MRSFDSSYDGRPSSSLRLDIARQVRELPDIDKISNRKQREEIIAEKQAIDSLTPEKLDQLCEAITKGSDYDPGYLHTALVYGSDETKFKVRNLLGDPSVLNRNQDLVLPHIQAALDGNMKAITFIEQHRLVIEENIPEWLGDAWNKEAIAAWRGINIKGNDFKKRLRKNRVSVTKKSKGSREYDELSTEAKEWFRERGGRNTFQGVSKIEKVVFYVPPSTYSGNAVLEAADELGFFFDTSYEGIPARNALLSYASGNVKARAIAEDIRRQIRIQKHINSRIVSTKLLIEESDNYSVDYYSPTVFGDHLREVIGREKSYIFAALLIDDISLYLNLPLTDQAKLAIWEGIKLNPWAIVRSASFAESFEYLEDLREKELEETALEQAYEKFFLDPSEQKRYRRSKYKTKKEVSVGKNKVPLANKKELKPKPPVRNKRIIIQAALESFSQEITDYSRYARVIDKLTSYSNEVFSDAVNQIYSGRSPEDIVEDLRRGRKLSTLNNDLNGTSEAPPQELCNLSEITADEEKEEIEFVFTKEAHTSMKDGVLRHATNNALDKFCEKPDLIDRKKINNLDAIWEIRIKNPAIRIYYRYLPEKKIEVLLVGRKSTQHADINRRLPSIVERYA